MEEFRLKGNEKFKAGDFAGAVEEYEQGLLAAAAPSPNNNEQTNEKEQRITFLKDRDERVKLLGNIGTCQRKLNQPAKAISAASRAIALDRLALKPRILRSVITAESNKADSTSIQTALKDGAMACLIDATATSRQQIEGPVLHWAGRELLNQSRQQVSSDNNNTRNGTAFTKVAKTRDNDLGLFASQDLPLTHTVVAGNVVPSSSTGAGGTLPFSIGLYAESFSVAEMTTTDQQQQQQQQQIVNNKDAGKVCLSCGRCASESLEVFPCLGCSGICGYCADCTFQKQPAIERHKKYECHRIQKLAGVYRIAETEEREGSDELLEIGFHVITTLAAMHDQADRNGGGGDYLGSSILSLKGNSDVLLAHSNVMQVLHSAIEEEGFADAKLIDQIAAICLCNSFQVADESGLPTCQVLFDTVLSRVNHSCNPNCEFDATLRCVRTIRPVKSGEELCISYIANLHYPTELRREQIQARFCFKCECNRCSSYLINENINSNNNNINNNDDDQDHPHKLDWLLLAARPGIDGVAAVQNSTKVVQNVVEFARQRDPDEVAPELLQDLIQVKNKLSLELLGTHYLMQDLRNAITFCASALDNRELVKQSCFEEWMMWEALFPTVALPVKKDKIKNMLLASSTADDGTPGPGTEWMMTWLALYDASMKK